MVRKMYGSSGGGGLPPGKLVLVRKVEVSDLVTLVPSFTATYQSYCVVADNPFHKPLTSPGGLLLLTNIGTKPSITGERFRPLMVKSLRVVTRNSLINGEKVCTRSVLLLGENSMIR